MTLRNIGNTKQLHQEIVAAHSDKELVAICNRFKMIFQAINKLMAPEPEESKGTIGFQK